VVSSGKKPVRRGRLLKVMGSAVLATLILGSLIWLNYGWIWIFWNVQMQEKNAPWKTGFGGLALQAFGDDWERQSRKLSGPHATNCGRVGVRGNPKAATECALKAFREGKPFRVRYDLQGIDSAVSAGLVYTPEGKLYGLDFDGDPAGGGGTSWSRQRVGKMACPLPFQMYVNPNGRLNCFGKEAVPPHDVMSPNSESY